VELHGPGTEDGRFKKETLLLLRYLRAAGGEARTGRLAEEANFDQNQQAIYRLRNHLAEFGLVEEERRVEIKGELRDAIVWHLTDKGRDYLDELGDEIDDLDDIVLRSEIHDELQLCRETIDHWADQTEEIEERMEGWQITMNRRGKRLYNAENKAKEAVTEAEDAYQKANYAHGRIEALEDDIKESRETAERIHHDLNIVVERLDDLESRLERINKDSVREKRLNDLENRVEEVANRTERAEGWAQQAWEKSTRSVIDRLFPWR